MFRTKKKTDYSGYASFFAIGALAGAAVALLYAPMTGKKMQKKLGNVTDKVIDKVEDTVDGVQSTVRKLARA
jgi:gas vesicle protein